MTRNPTAAGKDKAHDNFHELWEANTLHLRPTPELMEERGYVSVDEFERLLRNHTDSLIKRVREFTKDKPEAQVRVDIADEYASTFYFVSNWDAVKHLRTKT